MLAAAKEVVEVVKASAIERMLVIDLTGIVVASEASVQDCCLLNRCLIKILCSKSLYFDCLNLK